DAAAADGAPAADGPFVATVRAFRDNTLVALAVEAVAAAVRRNFGSQRAAAGPDAADGRPADGDERRIFLCAHVDRVLLGIPAEHVLEVIEGCDVTPLFRVPPLLRGLLNLRGQV